MRVDRRTFLKIAAGATIFSGLWPVAPALSSAATAPGTTGAILIVAHMDDEAIWFLPWLPRVEKVIITAFPLTYGHWRVLENYPPWYKTFFVPSRGLTTYEDFYGRWLDRSARRELITEDQLILQLWDIIADPDVTEIHTHSPWGEYGHFHHRLVSKVVRLLAAICGKNVWCPNIVARFPPAGRPHSTYETAYLPGFRQKRGLYQPDTFRRIRQLYLDETERAADQPWYVDSPLDFWTWGKGYNDFPQGYQSYFLAVDKGYDMTLDSPDIRQLLEDIPVFGI